jgi:DNA-binding transcriptional MocR family regulator
MDAYARLENLHMIEARPQSGHYVRHPAQAWGASLERTAVLAKLEVRTVVLGSSQAEIRRRLADPSLVPLGLGTPDADLLPMEKLNRFLAVQARRHPRESGNYAATKGMARLRMEIAKRMVGSGCALCPDDLVITSGCVEAVTLALQAVCRPGDTVAIGAPVYYRFLNLLQWMGLKILEIPSSPSEGMSVDVLEYALNQSPIHACIIQSNFNDPLGSLMPPESKRKLVDLLAERGIPLIEDDVYGDLCFGPVRPPAAKAFDRSGLVLLCASLSKTLAPGYRVGWIAAGRFQPEVEKLKALFNITSPSPTQLAMADFLATGGYDHHLRSLRRTCAERMKRVRETIEGHFPLGTKVHPPEGGTLLWVQLPESLDAGSLHEKALRDGIAIVPGSLFTMGDRYRNCFRLNGTFWSERIDQALRSLGGLAVSSRTG